MAHISTQRKSGVTVEQVEAALPPSVVSDSAASSVHNGPRATGAVDAPYLRDFVSVSDFTGVDPTGATESKAGIEKAITAAGAKAQLWWPEGIFIADNLKPLHGQRWSGPGILRRPVASTYSAIQCEGVTDVTIENPLEGQYTTPITENTGALEQTGDLVNCTLGAERITVTSRLSNNQGPAVRFYDSSYCECNANITNCIYGCVIGSGGNTNDPTPSPCEHNMVRGRMQALGKNGVFISGNTTGSEKPNPVGNHKVDGLTVVQPGDTGVELGQGSHNCTVTNLTVDGKNVGYNGVLIRDGYGHVLSGFAIRNFKMFANGSATYLTNGNGIYTWPQVTGEIEACSISNGVIEKTSRGVFLQGNNTTFKTTEQPANGGAGSAGTIYSGSTITNVIVKETQNGNTTGASQTTLQLHCFYIQSVSGWDLIGCKAINGQNDGFRTGDTNTGGSYCTEVNLIGCRSFDNGQQKEAGQSYYGFRINGTSSQGNITHSSCRASDYQTTENKSQSYGFSWNEQGTQFSAARMMDCTGTGNKTSRFQNCGTDLFGSLGGVIVTSAGTVTVNAETSHVIWSGTTSQTITLGGPSFVGERRMVRVVNEGTHAVTIAHSGSGTITPASLAEGVEHTYITDGTNWY